MKLNNGLNKMASKLITKHKIQNKKENKSYDNNDLRNARNQIKHQSKIAHATCDQEEHRLLKHLNNIYTRKDKRRKAQYEKEMLSNIYAKWKHIKEENSSKTPTCIKIDRKKSMCQRTIDKKIP